MRLLSGPPGSGKTCRVLDEVRTRLASAAADFRLVVPTATMAEHLRHQLAREGRVFRPALVVTLSKFIEPYARDLPQATEESLLLLIGAALDRLAPAEFRQVAGFPGFHAYLARLIEECSSAGGDFRRLSGLPLDSGLQRSFLRVFEEVERQLRRRGWGLRAERLQRAAQRIHSEGTPGIAWIYLDGFFSFTDPELAVIDALRRHARITVTLPPWEGSRVARDKLLAMGLSEETLPRVRAAPEIKIVAAPTLDREAEEIARRIVEENRAGRPFREMGVVVRSHDPYVPALRTTLERFGIPARFYFAGVLADHAAVRHLTGIVDAMLGGWEHEETLAILRRNAAGLGVTAAGDRLECEVLEHLPGEGLEALRAVAAGLGAGGAEITSILDSLREWERWKGATANPGVWGQRARRLRALFRNRQPLALADRLEAEISRSQAAALDAFDACLDTTAGSFEPESGIAFQEFWAELKTVLGQARLRVPDRRRDVVHVLDVYEARQWELPVVFVCGMLEKQFPRYHPQDAVFPDRTRVIFRAAGVRLATSADHDQEERFLFELATTRATSKLVLTYPRFNAKGDENLVSFYLNDFPPQREPTVAVRPRPGRSRASLKSAAIYDEALRDWICARNSVFSPTRLESFLQCPFQFFAARSLHLQGLPARPEERLDNLLQGQIAHAVIAEWRPGRDLDALFDEIFRTACEENRVPETHQTERVRLEMLRNLRQFAAELPAARGYTLFPEASFELALSDAVRIRGRIDRYEADAAGNAMVVDYKYSGGQRIRKRIEGHAAGSLVQGGLYLLAVERVFGCRPVSMEFWGFRGQITRRGWHDAQELREIAQQAESASIESARRIREGVIKVAPADPDECQYCDFRDGCRVETLERGIAAGGEAEWS